MGIFVQKKIVLLKIALMISRDQRHYHVDPLRVRAIRGVCVCVNCFVVMETEGKAAVDSSRPLHIAPGKEENTAITHPKQRHTHLHTHMDIHKQSHKLVFTHTHSFICLT